VSVAGFGDETDKLFNGILFITAVAFFATQGILIFALWKFGERGPAQRSTFIHGHHTLEIGWTLLPAIVLVTIAFVQLSTWKKIKFPSAFPAELQQQLAAKEPFAEVVAGQFDWRITYPGDDHKLGTLDDVHVLNNLHIVRGKKILIHLRSRDVLHSFYLPNLRLKQDAVPGMTIPVWFETKDNIKEGDYELMCAELCGWGHYKMKGNLHVHETEAGFQEWLKKAKAAEEASQ